MNLGDVVGQMMREGMTPAMKQRLEHAMGPGGLGGVGGSGGLTDVLGGLLGGSSGAVAGGGASQGGGLGGLLGSLGQMLGSSSGVGGMSKGEVGGLGALAGALLGGGGGSVKGAVGGSAMALLGTLAMSALQNWQASAAAGGAEAAPPAVSERELQQMTAPETAELCLLAMIEAAKADGSVEQAEMERIVGKLQEGGVSEAERAFVVEALRTPTDVSSIIARIPNREVGAQVYAAALMAVSVDTEAERAFLSALARGAGLDQATVGRLHALTGAPATA